MKAPCSPAPPLGLLTLLLPCVFLLALQPITSFDVWWHLATGRLIASTLAVPTVDHLSFTAAGATWTPHSWLADLAAYGLVEAWGLRALVVGLALTGALITAVAYLLLLRVGKGSHAAAFACLVAAVLPTRLVWNLRPGMLSVLMMLVYMLWLEGAGESRLSSPLRLVIGAAAVAAVWANLHAGAVTALVVAMAWVIAPPGDRETSERPWGPLRRRLPWLAVLGATAIALLASPNGSMLYREAMEVQSVSAGEIREWASPDFHKFWPLTYVLPATVVVLTLSPARPPLRHLLLYAFWLKMFLFSVRHIVFFGLATGLVLVRPAACLLGGLRLADGRWTTTLRRILNATTSRGLALTLVGLVLVSLAALGSGRRLPLEPLDVLPGRGLPSAALVAAYRSLPPDSRVFNTYRWGGYLLWLAPERPVFIDGRLLPYGRGLLAEHAAIAEGRPGWRSLVRARGVTHFLVERSAPLARLLVELRYPVLASDAEALLVVYQTP